MITHRYDMTTGVPAGDTVASYVDVSLSACASASAPLLTSRPPGPARGSGESRPRDRGSFTVADIPSPAKIIPRKILNKYS
jgi:hypothetical protein